MKKMQRLASLGLSLSMVLALAACGGGDTDPTPSTPTESNNPSASNSSTDTNNAATATPVSTEPQYGGNLTVYFQEFYNDYDPSVSDMRNYCMWYEPLFTMDWSRSDTGEVFTSEYLTMEWMDGQIAESYTFEDGILNVKIREDVYFQNKEPYNGRQCVAEDVKWSYDRVLGIGSGFTEPYPCMQDWAGLLNMVESIETDGDYNVIFHFNTDSELALNTFIITQVNIAGHEWDELTDDQKADWHYAAGTGPYILEEYVPDSYMKFVKNENYYDYDERYPENKLPYLDSITCQLFADSTAAQTQFMAGNLDVIAWGGSVLTQTEAELLEETMDEGSFVSYNFSSAPVGIGLKTTHPALDNLDVRKAMQMAINSQEIYSDYLGYDPNELNICGAWSAVTQYSSVDEWSQELMDSYTKYDPEGAKELLAQAGYPDGFEFDVTIFGNLDADLFTLAGSYLKEIGITMNLAIANSPPEMQQIGKDMSNQTSIFVSGGKASIAQIQAYFSNGGVEDSTGFHDDTFTAMVQDFFNCTTMEEAERIGKEIDTYWAEQHWCLYLGGAEVVNTFVSGRIGGYSGERLWKNWNSNQILARVWVTDGK